SEASAQATTVPSPPQDAPPLRPGQRVKRPYGELEISTVERSPKDQDTMFKFELLIRNQSPQEVEVPLVDYVRVIADGVPRAPEITSLGPYESKVKVRPESSEYAWATFRVRGQPRIVYLQVGVGDTPRSYLRWVD